MEPQGVTVETAFGRVRGRQADRHQFFLGVPFAAPPNGARRFAAPEPPPAWSGVREAAEFGPSAPQGPSPLPGMAVGPQAEDCLYLNVYTPACDGARRPVMVWIHGGGFTGGSGSQALYAGRALVERGDVVLVTVNYRLGALGYLHLPELAGAAAHPGQLDQIAALRWVRDHAAAFGGDAGNVTIFGESAGGMAVSTLLAMPAARGLFHRAIAQSGVARTAHSAESARDVADAVRAALTLGSDDDAKLREVPVDRLLAAQTRVQTELRAGGGGLVFAPVIDGDTLPVHPLRAIADGAAAGIDLIVGTNLDETKLFAMRTSSSDELDVARVERRVRGQLGRHADRAAEIVSAYRASRPKAGGADLIDAIETDLRFRVPSIRLAEAQAAHRPDRTYMYLFTWPSPARRGALGSCHALELPFVFGTLDAPTMDRFAGSGPEADALSERMMDGWLRFARAGDPNHAGIPEWRPYDADRRATLVFDRKIELVDAPYDAERAVWDGIL